MKENILKRVFIFGNIFSFFIWICLFLRNVDGLQRNIFFSDKNDWFMDFYNTVYYSVGKTPYSWGWIPARNYFPISYMILYPFTFFYPYDQDDWGTSYIARYSQLSGIAVAVFLTISFGCLFYCLYKKCQGTEFEKIGMMLSLFVSGVTIYNFDRANELILAAAFLCVFLMTYESKRKLLNHIGFVCLALSASMKIFPAMFGVLLLYKKKYREAVITIAYGILFAFLPFLWLEGNVGENLLLFIKALREHAAVYADGMLRIYMPDNIWGKILPYLICVIVLVFAKNINENWKQVLFISLAVILTSGQQEYYCLIFLFYPIVLFFNANHKVYDIVYIIGFILLLSPLQYEFDLGFFVLTSKKIVNAVCNLMYVYLLIETFYASMKWWKYNK